MKQYLLHVFFSLTLTSTGIAAFAQPAESALDYNLFHDILISERCTVYHLRPKSEKSNEKTLKGYAIAKDSSVDQTTCNNWKLILTSNDSYIRKGVSVACPFLPDIALLFSGEKIDEPLIVLISSSCKKVMFSRSNVDVWDEQHPTFRLLRVAAGKKLLNSDMTLHEISDFEGSIVVQQLLVFERAAANNDWEVVRMLPNTQFFSNVECTGPRRKPSQILLRLSDDVNHDEKSTFDSPVLMNKLPALKKMAEQKYLHIQTN